MLSSYNNKSAKEIISLTKNKDSSYWMDLREKHSLELFHKASKKVPAYKDFLKKGGVNPGEIKTWDDFQKVPPMSKKNYLRKYPLEKLCWGGKLDSPMVYTATSGSTGEPFYFLRSKSLDWQYSVLLEEYLERGGVSKKGPTLVVICFGMGLWIGGLITYKAFELASLRNNYPVSIITPGFNKKEIFNILKTLSPKYERTVIVGYPPLVKDVVDESLELGIPLKKFNVRFLFAAESITEQFRDYLAEKAGISKIYTDFMNIYGSADIGAMAVETTSSILVKRMAGKNENVFKDIFSPIRKTPTLAQFNPLFTSFESVDSEILITGNSALPLIRYSIGDNGGVFSYDEMVSKLKVQKIDFLKEAKDAGISEHVQELPFVYVYERADLSTTFYGLLIYPEWIKTALYGKVPKSKLTGKFTMITKNDKNQNQYLEINFELMKGKKLTEAEKKQLLSAVVGNLKKKSSEYREIFKGLGKFAYPKLVFWPFEDPLYFKTGIKQKWVLK